MDAKYDIKRATKFAIQPTHQDANMALLKENKQLKSMLLLHLNVIQEQNNMIVAKDKQLAALQAKLDRLEAKNAGLKPSTPGQDENTPISNNTPPTLAGVVPTGLVGNPAGIVQGSVRPVVQHLSRGQIMKMASLNQTSGGQLRIRPLMISLKKVMPAGVADQKAVVTTIKSQNIQKSIPVEGNQSGQQWIQFLNSGSKFIKAESVGDTAKDDTKMFTLINVDQSTGRASSPVIVNNFGEEKLEKQMPIKQIAVTQDYTNGDCVGVVNSGGSDRKSSDDDDDEEKEEHEDIIMMDTDDAPEIIVSDGSPIDIPIELKLEDDDDALSSGSPIKQQQQPPLPSTVAVEQVHQHKEQITKINSSPPSIVKCEPNPNKPKVTLAVSESVPKVMRFEKNRRSPSECSNRAPRKYSRVMSTRKLYVTRHWEEEEDPEEANSLVVPELKEGESNLEVPNWKEVDALGLEEEIQSEDAGNALAEDLSPAAYLKRHAKHEADERRRKKWDIQRFREQRTIEKLKKRQCKSDIYYSLSGMQCSGEDQQQTEPLSLYPSLNSIRHVETTEYLPVQAFGEPIPTLTSGEFGLPWMGGSGTVESIEMPLQHQQQSLSQDAKEGLSGCLGFPGAAAEIPSSSKFSSFYVKQNNSTSSLPLRVPGNSSSSNSAKYRFKRVKSQGSSSGARR